MRKPACSHALASAFIAMSLAGCSKTVNLRYQPKGPPAVLASPGPFKVFVQVDGNGAVAKRTARDGSQDDPIRFAQPFPGTLKAALETELARVGVTPTPAKGDADAVLTASALSLQCYTGVISAAELRFALRLEDPEGKLLMDGRVHSAAGAGSWWRCAAASDALGDSMEQVGSLLDASDALLLLQGGSVSTPPPSGIPFPAPPGTRPRVYLFPPQDRVGLIFNDNNGVDPVLPYFGDAAHPFTQAARAILENAGLEVVDRKADADWILKTSLESAHAVFHYTSPPQRASIQLSYNARLEDRSGAVLHEDELQGSGQWSGMVASQGKVYRTVRDAMGEAAGQLAAFLNGEATGAQPTEAAAPPEAVSVAASDDGAGALQIAAGLLGSFLPGASNLEKLARRLPGGAKLDTLVHKTGKLRSNIKKAEDVYDKVKPQADETPSGDSPDGSISPVSAPAPASPK